MSGYLRVAEPSDIEDTPRFKKRLAMCMEILRSDPETLLVLYEKKGKPLLKSENDEERIEAQNIAAAFKDWESQPQ